MAKHTAGEWKVRKPRKRGEHWQVMAEGKLGGKGAVANVSVSWVVATIYNGAPGDTWATIEANACLMAASPKLLAACKMILAGPHDAEAIADMLPEIAAAIAAAEPEAGK